MNGKIMYPSGDTNILTYTFVKNYDYGPKIGYLETDDNQRALDGTLNGFVGPLKKYYELTFTRALKAQFDFFMILYRFKCPIDLYMDGTNLDGTVYLMNTPEGGPEAAFPTPGTFAYSFSVRFEEI